MGAQEDGDFGLWLRRADGSERTRSSQWGIAAVDFPVIYGNIAALFLCPMPTYAPASKK